MPTTAVTSGSPTPALTTIWSGICSSLLRHEVEPATEIAGTAGSDSGFDFWQHVRDNRDGTLWERLGAALQASGFPSPVHDFDVIVCLAMEGRDIARLGASAATELPRPLATRGPAA
jgi:hypothetical protein